MKKPPDPPPPPSQQPSRRSRSTPRSSLLCSAKQLHSLPPLFNSNFICLQCYAPCKSLSLIVTIGSSPMFHLNFSIQICIFFTGSACPFSLRVTSIDGPRKPFQPSPFMMGQIATVDDDLLQKSLNCLVFPSLPSNIPNSSQELCGAVQSKVPWPFKIQQIIDAFLDFNWHSGMSYCNAILTAIWAQGREPLIWVAKVNIHHNSPHSNSGALVPLSFLVMTNSMILFDPDCCWVSISSWILQILVGIVKDLGGFMFTHRSLLLLDLAFCVLEFAVLGGFYSIFVKFMNCNLMVLGVNSLLGWQGVNLSIFRWVLLGCSLGSLLGYCGRWDTIKWMSHANFSDLSSTGLQFALIRRLKEYFVMHLYYCNLLLPAGLFDLGVATLGMGTSRVSGSIGRLRVAPRWGKIDYNSPLLYWALLRIWFSVTSGSVVNSSIFETLCCLFYSACFLAKRCSEMVANCIESFFLSLPLDKGFSQLRCVICYSPCLFTKWSTITVIIGPIYANIRHVHHDWILMLGSRFTTFIGWFGLYYCEYWNDCNFVRGGVVWLSNGLLTTIHSFSIIINNMWNRLSEYRLWTTVCKFFLWISPDYVAHVCSTVPGRIARFSVAPIFGEQPAPGIPRCSYSWPSGSMMHSIKSESSRLILLLQFWCFKLNDSYGMDVLFTKCNLPSINNGLQLRTTKVWVYMLDSQGGEYIMVLLCCFFDKNGMVLSEICITRLSLLSTSFWKWIRLLTEQPNQWAIDKSGPKESRQRSVMQFMWLRSCEEFIDLHWLALDICNVCFDDFIHLQWTTLESCNVRCMKEYYDISEKSKVSEVIGLSKPYTTSKAYYQTAFGLRTFIFCSRDY